MMTSKKLFNYHYFTISDSYIFLGFKVTFLKKWEASVAGLTSPESNSDYLIY